MKHVAGFCASILLAALLSGCAPTITAHTVDVTNDPRFQTGYRAGQIFRTKSDGYLIIFAANSSNPKYELWTAVSYEQSKYDLPAVGTDVTQIIKIPAGATLRIDRLQYAYEDDHPVTPGGPFTALSAYGTLTPASGNPFPNPVMAPLRVGSGHTVSGTSVQTYGPPEEFLEEVSRSGKN